MKRCIYQLPQNPRPRHCPGFSPPRSSVPSSFAAGAASLAAGVAAGAASLGLVTRWNAKRTCCGEYNVDNVKYNTMWTPHVKYKTKYNTMKILHANPPIYDGLLRPLL